ncbi:hypothetical protein [Acinetobacter guillouiae]|uniref:hypothetical protein n=1 Tax=Acinetobacter guillouiae TaxID=106649 RepID=UPI001CD76972|nr:hypothetical protein [Acinetobacter guillouiae]
MRDQYTMDLCEELEGLKYQPIINHGTVYAYNKHKCRCEFCKEAKAISNQRSALKAKMKTVDLGVNVNSRPSGLALGGGV